MGLHADLTGVKLFSNYCIYIRGLVITNYYYTLTPGTSLRSQHSADLYGYKRLSFSINSGAETFHQTLPASLRGSPGVFNISDYIIVKVNTFAEQDEHLLEVILNLTNM